MAAISEPGPAGVSMVALRGCHQRAGGCGCEPDSGTRESIAREIHIYELREAGPFGGQRAADAEAVESTKPSGKGAGNEAAAEAAADQSAIVGHATDDVVVVEAVEHRAIATEAAEGHEAAADVVKSANDYAVNLVATADIDRPHGDVGRGEFV